MGSNEYHLDKVAKGTLDVFLLQRTVTDPYEGIIYPVYGVVECYAKWVLNCYTSKKMYNSFSIQEA